MTCAAGLSEVLRGDTDLNGSIRETPIPNLWLISAGQSDPVALQTLALDNIQQIFDQLRPQYEFILVDSCPVLPVADLYWLASTSMRSSSRSARSAVCPASTRPTTAGDAGRPHSRRGRQWRPARS